MQKLLFSIIFIMINLLTLHTTLAIGTISPAPPVDNQFYAEIDDNDPFEDMNRSTFTFNKFFDDYLLVPVTKTYQTIMPRPGQIMANNFFNNLNEIPTIGNDILQLNLKQCLVDTSRLVINSTLGIAGLVDVASHMGLVRNTEDFGLTLMQWGWKNSRYIVIPLLGSSTIRDGIAKPIDYHFFSVYPYLNDDTLRYSLLSLYFIDQRRQALELQHVIKKAVIDEYAFVRSAYLQHRAYSARCNKEAKPNKLISLEDLQHGER